MKLYKMEKSRKNNIVPEYINKKPDLMDFGYTEESIKIASELYKKEKSNVENIFLTIGIIIFIILTIYFFNKFVHDYNNIPIIIGMFFLAMLNGFVFSILISIPTLVPLNIIFENKVEKKFVNMLNYFEKLKAFEYWERRSQREFWYSLSGIQFEKELAKLFKIAHYNVTLTKGSGDKGIDIFLNLNNQNIIVQCKAHKNAVGPAIAREIFGSLIDSKCDKAIIASITGFTKGVYEFCSDKNIELWDLEKILEFKNNLSIS